MQKACGTDNKYNQNNTESKGRPEKNPISAPKYVIHIVDKEGKPQNRGRYL